MLADGLVVAGPGLAAQRFWEGAWDDASAQGDRAVRGLIAFHRNDLEGAGAAAQAGDDAPWGGWLRALVDEAGGSTATALATLTYAWAIARDATGDALALAPDLIRMSLAHGEDWLAARVAATALAAGDTPGDAGEAWEMRCRGLLAGDPEVLSAAADGFAAAGQPFAQALCLAEAGAAWAARGIGGMADAMEALGQAQQLFGGLGAARDVARTAAALRALGVRPGARGTRQRPQLGWEALTPSERRVAGMVAAGLSNPQIAERLFVSPRTVKAHVAHAFEKLGVASRVELALMAVRHREAS